MKSFKLFAEQASPMINPPKNEFDNKKDVVEGNSGAKYQIKSIGKDSKGEYYISPSTGKKVYKSAVNKGDHENPKTGNITAKVVKEDQELKAAVDRRDQNRKKYGFSKAEKIYVTNLIK